MGQHMVTRLYNNADPKMIIITSENRAKTSPLNFVTYSMRSKASNS